MNLHLLNPFGDDHPVAIESRLSHAHTASSTIVAYNRRGTLLAAGSSSGTCFVWDMCTLSIAATLTGHMREVCSLSWSRSSEFLLTASLDYTCCLWGLADTRRHVVGFTGPVLSACLQPAVQPLRFAAIVRGQPPYMVERELSTWRRTALALAEHSLAAAISFAPNGKHLLVATTAGTIAIFDAHTLHFLTQTVVSPNMAVRQMHFSHNGRWLAVNSNDKTIRLYSALDIQGLKLTTKYTQAVDPIEWRQIAISANEEYIYSGIHRLMQPAPSTADTKFTFGT